MHFGDVTVTPSLTIHDMNTKWSPTSLFLKYRICDNLMLRGQDYASGTRIGDPEYGKTMLLTNLFLILKNYHFLTLRSYSHDNWRAGVYCDISTDTVKMS